MKLKSFTLALLCSGLGFATVSCEKEETAVAVNPQANLKSASAGNLAEEDATLSLGASSDVDFDCSYEAFSQALVASISADAVLPTPCVRTPFDAAIAPYSKELSLAPDKANYNLLAQINQLYTYVDPNVQYFGVDGHLTDFAAKHKRTLESFFNMPNEVALHGQHVSTLQDREAVAAVYINFSALKGEAAYRQADNVIRLAVTPSTIFKTTPLLAFDGFATTGTVTQTKAVIGNLIVIGDGIVSVMAEAGVDEKVTFAGILAHEWAHQVQFNNYSVWYKVAEPSAAAQTRKTELEADFMASYYLTHKRGATYNWKSVAEFFDLFFNIGDCGFTSAGHHGTPYQRLAASRLGWIIAQETMPMGHILTAEELHILFTASLQTVLDNKVDSSEAFASLKSSQLKAVYGNVLKRENELKSIMNGSLDKAAIKNLK